MVKFLAIIYPYIYDMYRAKTGVREFTIPSLHAVGPRCAHWIGRPHNRGGGRSHTRHMRSYGFLGRGTMMFQTPTPIPMYRAKGEGSISSPHLACTPWARAVPIGLAIPTIGGGWSHTRPMRSYEFLWVVVLWCSRPPSL